MNKTRLEAFSDAVIAIVLTIMILEIKTPEGYEWKDLVPLIPKFIGYVLSFIYIIIYWGNHHNLFQLVKVVDGKIIWANTVFIFFISLLSFASDWLSESNFSKEPTILYGIILLCTSMSYMLLVIAIRGNKVNESFRKAIKLERKEGLSLIFYSLGIILAFFSPILAIVLYFLIPIAWFIPEKRAEKFFKEEL